jgi:hypothetical protein
LEIHVSITGKDVLELFYMSPEHQLFGVQLKEIGILLQGSKRNPFCKEEEEERGKGSCETYANGDGSTNNAMRRGLCAHSLAFSTSSSLSWVTGTTVVSPLLLHATTSAAAPPLLP